MRATRMLSRRTVIGLLAVAALLAAAGSGVAGESGAKGPQPDATIKIKLRNGSPVFTGPDTIPVDSQLQVVNKTDPNAIGPHSFSLVEKSELPRTEAQREKCGRTSNRKLVCKDIAEAHQISHRHADMPVVENGAPTSWDSSFDGTNDGDSWFAQGQGE